MTKENARYSVFLGVDPESPYGALLGHFGSTMLLEDGRKLLHFWCTEVDASHPVYLDITALDRDGAASWDFRIPHHQVLLISDPADAEKLKIGFV